MEGFDPKQFDEILELKNKNLTSVVTAALGYRSTEDSYSNLPKVRRPKQDLFIELA
jgi:nitroreductase/dihydropteridine reductase